jgi:hypothetical protein
VAEKVVGARLQTVSAGVDHVQRVAQDVELDAGGVCGAGVGALDELVDAAQAVEVGGRRGAIFEIAGLRVAKRSGNRYWPRCIDLTGSKTTRIPIKGEKPEPEFRVGLGPSSRPPVPKLHPTVYDVYD